ncbi:MAG: SRPBCC domain-containing protein [Saprospiraceae bacterium]|nr:SRPBCC domain-containing protein [Saprospiraceae bacterium]
MSAKALYTENEILIDASTSKIWDVLTNPAQTVKYMYGCQVQTDWIIDEPILWIGAKDGVAYVKGQVIHIEPTQSLTYSVIDPHGDYEDILENYLQVTYTLTDANGRTKLHVRQGDYATAANGEQRYQDSIAEGGWQSILVKIKDICESE